MVNVRNTKCAILNCNRQPSYNYKGKKRRLYCRLHKKEGMIIIGAVRCQEVGCETIALYNYHSETKAEYCSVHKKDDMIDIKHIKCIENECNTRPSYNYYGESVPLYCMLHKKTDMINIIDKKCIETNCLTQPSYNFEGEKVPLYCMLHKKDDMINIISPRCKGDLCYTIISNKNYRGYCMYCFINLYPDEPNSRNYKTKERAVVEFILSKFPKELYTWIEDKRIEDGCSKRRPDLRLDLGYMVVIVEIDENQHRDYDCSCENKRLMEISQDVGHRPIVFIRFNPDEYKTNESNVTSCWGVDGRGMCVVKKKKLKEWEERLESLRAQIEYWIQPENTTEKTIEVVQLYYDTSFDDEYSYKSASDNESDMEEVAHGGAGGLTPKLRKRPIIAKD